MCVQLGHVLDWLRISGGQVTPDCEQALGGSYVAYNEDIRL